MEPEEIQRELAELRRLHAEDRKLLVGNGKPEEGLAMRVALLQESVTDLEHQLADLQGCVKDLESHGLSLAQQNATLYKWRAQVERDLDALNGLPREIEQLTAANAARAAESEALAVHARRLEVCEEKTSRMEAGLGEWRARAWQVGLTLLIAALFFVAAVLTHKVELVFH
jgi:TolA-binding protein